MREVREAEAGAPFHTWAVWGSRKAGVTIRHEGLDRALREVTILALCAGLLTGFLLGLALSPLASWLGRARTVSGRRCQQVIHTQGSGVATPGLELQMDCVAFHTHTRTRA